MKNKKLSIWGVEKSLFQIVNANKTKATLKSTIASQTNCEGYTLEKFHLLTMKLIENYPAGVEIEKQKI